EEYKNVSLLLHTNFIYADEQLKPIASKKKFQRTKIKHPRFSNVVCQNSAFGCMMMINKKLLSLVGEIPKIAENHDYWIALVASAFGKIFYLNKRTILYRQHVGNLSPKHDFNSFSKRFQRIFVDKGNFKDVKSKVEMALEFRKVYYDKLSTANKKVICDFIALLKNKTGSLFLKNIKNGLRRQTFGQTLLFYFTILLSKKNQLVK
ncbi:MAG TPA: hypothetical protein VGI61_10265, partial [Parafilimonas sp.]